MSHTPGPWTISDDHGKRWIETLANDDTICEVHRRDTRVGRYRDCQFHANAHLIASAPDLLDALKEIASYPEPDALELKRIARVAIAEAIGK